MYILDKDRARKILLEQEFTPYQADNLLQRFPPLQPSLGAIVEQWLDKHTVPDVIVGGISLHEVMKNRDCHFLVAIRDLNKFLDPALAPEKREQWRKILTTPVYYE